MSSTPEATTDLYYRYEDAAYSHYDEYTDSYVTGMRYLALQRFAVLRFTPKGAVIYTPHNPKRFVSKHTNKQYAHSTPEAALKDYIIRKQYQKRKMERRAEIAGIYLSLAQNQLKQLSKNGAADSTTESVCLV